MRYTDVKYSFFYVLFPLLGQFANQQPSSFHTAPAANSLMQATEPPQPPSQQQKAMECARDIADAGEMTHLSDFLTTLNNAGGGLNQPANATTALDSLPNLSLSGGKTLKADSYFLPFRLCCPKACDLLLNLNKLYFRPNKS